MEGNRAHETGAFLNDRMGVDFAPFARRSYREFSRSSVLALRGVWATLLFLDVEKDVAWGEAPWTLAYDPQA